MEFNIPNGEEAWATMDTMQFYIYRKGEIITLHPHGEEAWGPWVGIDQIASVVWKLCNFIFIEKVRSEPLHPQWRGGVGPLCRNRSFLN